MLKKLILSFVTLLFFFIQTPTLAAQKLTVLLDWFANPSHAPLFVAQQQGFFAQQGLDVNLIGPADPSDPPKLVAANKADMAITYEPQFLQQTAEGLPLIHVGTLVDKPLDCLAVLETSPVTNISLLKNKKIGYSAGGVTSVMLKTMLTHNKLSLNDVQAINVHYDLSQALLSGKVDAVIGFMRTFEVYQMQLAGHPVRIFLPENNGVPTYSELIFVMNKNHANDPRVPKFLTALQQGVTYLKQHPEETWQVFAKNHPELNDELNHRAWLASIPYFATNPAATNQQAWQQFKTFMQQNGLLQGKKTS